MSTLPKIVVIGGTGAQGVPIVKALSKTDKYEVVVLTRDKSSGPAQTLAALPHVSLFEGTYIKEADLWAVFEGAHGAFVNTDGFVIGEKNEVFWGMRIFEVAVGSGVKQYVWGSVPYLTKLGKHDPKYRSGHMDAKGRVGEWLLAQKLDGVTVTLFTTCLYMEMLYDSYAPETNEDGSFTFYSSIGDGVIPLITLDDVGEYVAWIFANPTRVANLDFQVVTDIVSFSTIVSTFEQVTGKKAHWRDLPYDEFAAIKHIRDDVPAAWAHKPGEYDDKNGMSFKTNMKGFWNGWRDSLVTWKAINVKLLDEANPGRIRSLEDWMVKVGYEGTTRKVVLKDAEVVQRFAASV